MIRPSTPEDNFWVGQMLLTVPISERKHLTVFSTPSDLAQLYLDVDEGRCIIIMDNASTPIGFMTYRYGNLVDITVTQLLIIPNMRRRYGKSAMHDVLSFLRYRRVICFIHDENKDMRRLAEYAKFELKDTHIYDNGEIYHRYIRP